ncbi:MAG: SixA phosphatase family protein [Mangrovibacterium sp.]
MKTIVMIRHAKAESGGYDDDFNRKLQIKGEHDATQLSGKLKAVGIVPQRMIASPAARAWATASIYAQQLGFNTSKIEAWEAFYEHATTQDLLEKIHATSADADCLFIVGHNPTIHYLAYNLCDEFLYDMPTCATSVIQFDVKDWTDIEARTGKVFLHLEP